MRVCVRADFLLTDALAEAHPPLLCLSRSVPLKSGSPRLEKRLVPACPFTSFYPCSQHENSAPPPLPPRPLLQQPTRRLFRRTVGGRTEPPSLCRRTRDAERCSSSVQPGCECEAQFRSRHHHRRSDTAISPSQLRLVERTACGSLYLSERVRHMLSEIRGGRGSEPDPKGTRLQCSEMRRHIALASRLTSRGWLLRMFRN